MTYTLARAPTVDASAFVFSARDEFDQVVSGGSDPLDTLAMPVGGPWDTSPSGTYDATDFVVEDTGHTAQRSEVSDASGLAGRYAVASGATLTSSVVVVECQHGVLLPGFGEVLLQGVFARFTDTDNWVMCLVEIDRITGVTSYWQYSLQLVKRIGGSVVGMQGSYAYTDTTSPFTLTLEVSASGVVTGRGGGIVLSDALGAGELTSGKTGFYDAKVGSNALVRNYRNFAASVVPNLPAALHASRSMRFTHEAIYRDSADGTLEGRVPIPEGKYPTVIPATRSGRKSRLVVKGRRFDQKSGLPDLGIADALTGDMTVTPRVDCLTGTDVTPGGFPIYQVTGSLTDRTYNANTATPQEIVNVLSTAINDHALGSVSGFTATSYTPTFTLDCDAGSWEQIADVLGTVLNALQTTPGAAPAFSFPGMNINRVLPATTVSPFTVADVLASWTTDLESNGAL